MINSKLLKWEKIPDKFVYDKPTPCGSNVKLQEWEILQIPGLGNYKIGKEILVDAAGVPISVAPFLVIGMDNLIWTKVHTTEEAKNMVCEDLISKYKILSKFVNDSLELDEKKEITEDTVAV